LNNESISSTANLILGISKKMHAPELLNAFSFLNGQQQGLSLVYFVDGKLKESIKTESPMEDILILG
jgi:hypothetical protein